jgi:hypothetical protein
MGSHGLRGFGNMERMKAIFIKFMEKLEASFW